MYLMVASILGAAIFKAFKPKSEQWNEQCPEPFYGTDEYVSAFKNNSN